MDILSDQYELVKNSRRVLLDFCGTLSSSDFHRNMETFGGRSVGFLLVHIINVYRYWLEQFGMDREPEFFAVDKVANIEKVREAFNLVDKCVKEFLELFPGELQTPVTKQIPGKGRQLTTTPFCLFMHVTTHEFHHKGQILSMSRQLGYTPPDTDIIRFE